MPQTRHVRAITAGLIVLPGLVYTVARLAGWDTFYPAIQLMAYAEYAAVAAVIPVAVALLLRQWVTAGVAALVVAVLVGLIVPRMTADASAHKDGATVRVMSANLLEGGADPIALAALVRENNVDVLALQEFTPEFERAFLETGIDSLLPYHVAYAKEAVFGSAIYARLPLADDGLRINPPDFGQAMALMTVDGRSIPIESVHTRSPSDKQATSWWRDSFAIQPRAGQLKAAQPGAGGGEPRILVGDFNATLDHSPMRALLATGYRDAADVLGQGLTPTWPYDGQTLPPVTLDHVLADVRIGVRAYQVFRLAGTDHRPILAELSTP